jgi:hypothetical protein
MGAAASHPATNRRVKILATSTPPSHTINLAELAGIDLGLQLCHTRHITDKACSLRLTQGFMRCPISSRKHNPRINHTPPPHRCTSGIRTHLGKIKAHYRSLGIDYADTLAIQVADEHHPNKIYITGLKASIGIWIWPPYTLIPKTHGEQATPQIPTSKETPTSTTSNTLVYLFRVPPSTASS